MNAGTVVAIVAAAAVAGFGGWYYGQSNCPTCQPQQAVAPVPEKAPEKKVAAAPEKKSAPAQKPAAKAAPAPAQARAVAPTPAPVPATVTQNVTVNITGGVQPTKVETTPVVATPAPAAVTSSAPAMDASCPSGVTVAQFVWEAKALDTATEVNGKSVTVHQFIDGLGQGSVTDPTSRLFGGAFFARAKAGEITQAGKFPAVMTLDRAGAPTREIWKGEVGAGATRDIAIPDFRVGDTVRVSIQGDLASPRGGKDIHFTRTAGGCKLALHAIAAR